MHLSSSPFTVKPVAVAAVMALATLAAHSPLAQAQASVAASQQLNLNIAAQPLGQALNALAQQANLQMSFPAALVAGKQAPVVSGRMSVKQALDLLLESHGLTAVLQGNAVVVRQLDVVKQSEVVLPVVTVTAATDNDPGQLPKAFAGGQVASGARIGVLGNRDIFETPVSVVAYTSELALNQQARTVAEVLRNDTSVKITQNTNSGGTDDVYNLRGFLSASTASTYDGLPRLIGRSQALEGIERVELLKGPTAFAVGSALFSPGGMINFVPKRATDQPITRLTTRYYSDSVLGLHADVGRRFGSDDQFGIRVNAAFRDGEAPINDVSKSNEVFDVALDYRGERLRAYLNLDYSKAATTNFLGGTSIASGVEVPSAPDNHNRWSPAWGYDYPQTKKRVAGRLEWDFTDRWTGNLVYGQLDQRDGEYTYCGSTITNSAGDVSYANDCYRGGYQSDVSSLDANIVGRFKTGQVGHRLTLGFARTKNEGGGPFEYFTPSGQTGSNIYNPVHYSRPSNIPSFASTAYNKASEENTRSIYASDELSFLEDKLLINLGVRRVDFNFGSFNQVSGQRTAPATDKGATTPFVGGVFKLTPALAVFGNVAESLEQGSTAPNNSTVDNPGQILPPQTSKQREVGIKFSTGSFAVTTALFQIERENAVTINRRFGYFGTQRNRGLELNLFGEPSSGVRILSGLTYLSTKQINTTVATTEGKQAIGVPKLQVQLGGEVDLFSWVPGLTLTGGAAYQGKQYVDNTNTRSIPGWTRLDAGVRLATKVSGYPTTVRMNVENLTDKNYWGSVDRGVLYLGQPRTLSLSASVDF